MNKNHSEEKAKILFKFTGRIYQENAINFLWVIIHNYFDYLIIISYLITQNDGNYEIEIFMFEF